MLRLMPFELRQDLWHQKTRVFKYCGIMWLFCMILGLSVLIQYQHVTDMHTRDKHGHTMMASTVVATLLMVKMGYVTTPHSAVVIHRLEIAAINLCTKFEVCFHKL